MGKQINIVTYDGKVVSVDEETAGRLIAAQQARPESIDEESNRAREDVQAREHSGIGSKIGTAIEGAADTATGGLYGKAAGYFAGDEYAANFRARAQENPGSHLAGEAAGLLAPTGLFGDTAKAAGELSAVGQTARAGELVTAATGSKTLGRLAEGAAFGAQGYVAQTNVTGDPLTVEAAIESAGLGALINLGAGVGADKLRGLSASARESVDRATQQRADLEIGQAANKVFNDPPPSWNEFRDSHAAATAATKAINRDIARDASDYADFVASNSKLTKAIDSAQDVINEVRNSRYAASARAVTEAAPEASPFDLSDVQAEGPTGGNVQTIEGQPRGVLTAYDEAGNPRTVLVNSKPPISGELDAKLRGYSARVSRIYKLKAGGWEADTSGRWVRDPSVPPRPQAALDELRTLQSDLAQHFPKASGALRDLPPIPRDPMPLDEVRLPATPRDFARMRPETIAKLANGLDPASAEAFTRFTQDVGLAPQETAAATVAGVHAKLGEFTSVLDRLEKQAADLAAKDEARPPLLRLLDRAARYSAASALHVTGPFAPIARVVAGEAVGKILGGATEEMGGVLSAGKLSIQQKVQALLAKYGNGGAAALERLGPVTSYLSRSFPDGTPDPEIDPRKQAVNRINEIRGASLTAGDHAFLAVQGLLGMPGDVAFKMHQAIVGAVQHLSALAPLDPGLNVTMRGSNWTPRWDETIALAHRLEAVLDPMAAITRVLAGDGHPAAVNTLRTIYPAIMGELEMEWSLVAPQLRDAPDRTRAFSILLSHPVAGLQHPVVVSTLQGLYLPKPAPNLPGPPSRPPGRPPAVANPVAGSNVSALINQK